jgi:hypothetical protein
MQEQYGGLVINMEGGNLSHPKWRICLRKAQVLELYVSFECRSNFRSQTDTHI